MDITMTSCLILLLYDSNLSACMNMKRRQYSAYVLCIVSQCCISVFLFLAFKNYPIVNLNYCFLSQYIVTSFVFSCQVLSCGCLLAFVELSSDFLLIPTCQQMPYAALIVLITCGVSVVVGTILVYWYFSRMKKLKYYLGLDDVSCFLVEVFVVVDMCSFPSQ